MVRRREDVVGLRHEADALGDQVVGPLVGDVLALERHRAGADLHQAEQRLEQRRLAGAVGADDADQLVLLAVEVGAVEDVHPGQVAGDQVVGAQHGALGRLQVRRRGRSGRSRASRRRPRLARGVTHRVLSRRSARRSCGSLSSRSLARSRPRPRRGSAPPCLAEVLVVVRAEVGVDDALVAHHGVRRTLGDHLALGHHDDPVGDVADHVHVVLDEQHRAALVAQRLHVPEQRLLQGGVHAGHRLVEHHQLGVGHQGPGHLEQLALAAGQRAGEVLALLVEQEAREQVVGPLGVRVLLAAPQRREHRAQQASRPSGRWRRRACSRCTVSLESTLVSWKVRTMPQPGDPVGGHALEAACR